MKRSYIILLVSLILFMASLPFTAVYTKDSEIAGLTCFLLGWAEILGSGFVWMANPLLFVAAFFLLLKQIKISTVISFIALSLTLSYLSVGEITVNEAGHASSITGYGPAYFLWVSSCLSLFAGNILIVRQEKASQS